MTAAIKIKDGIQGRRNATRVSYPMTVKVSGRQFTAINWNETGFQLPIALTEVFPDQPVAVEINLPYGEMDLNFSAWALSVWSSDKAGSSGFRFSDMEPHTRTLLSKFRIALQTPNPPNLGGIVEDLSIPTITPEAPETPPRQQTGAAPPQAPTPPQDKEAERLPRRSLAISFIYAVLGVLLTLFIISSLYAYFTRLTIDSAVVSRPVEKIIAPLNGVITKAYVTAGEQVKSGDPLLKLKSVEDRLELSRAETALNKAELELDQAKAKLESSKRSLGVYQGLTEDRLNAAKAALQNAQSTLQLAKSELKSARQLKARQVISTLEYDSAFAKLQHAKSAYNVAMAEFRNLERINQETHDGSYYSSQRKEFDLSELVAAVDAAQQRVELARQRLTAAKASEYFKVTAPFDAKVISFPKSQGNAVVSAEPLAVLEKLTEPVIDAFLTHTQLAKIRLGSEARVYIPALGKSFTAVVTGIDPTARFTQDETIRYSWQVGASKLNDIKTGRVTLQLKHAEVSDESLGSLAGLPAEVTFKKVGRPLLGLGV